MTQYLLIALGFVLEACTLYAFYYVGSLREKRSTLGFIVGIHAEIGVEIEEMKAEEAREGKTPKQELDLDRWQQRIVAKQEMVQLLLDGFKV